MCCPPKRRPKTLRPHNSAASLRQCPLMREFCFLHQRALSILFSLNLNALLPICLLRLGERHAVSHDAKMLQIGQDIIMAQERPPLRIASAAQCAKQKRILVFKGGIEYTQVIGVD